MHLGEVISCKTGGWGRKTVKQESQYKCLSSSDYSDRGSWRQAFAVEPRRMCLRTVHSRDRGSGYLPTGFCCGSDQGLSFQWVHLGPGIKFMRSSAK